MALDSTGVERKKGAMEQVSTPIAERLRDYLCYSHDVTVTGDLLNVQPGYSVYDLLQSSKAKTETDLNNVPYETNVSTPDQKIPSAKLDSSGSGEVDHLRRRGRPRSEDIELLQNVGKRAKSLIQCKFCFREFPREKSLQAHIRVHTGMFVLFAIYCLLLILHAVVTIYGHKLGSLKNIIRK